MLISLNYLEKRFFERISGKDLVNKLSLTGIESELREINQEKIIKISSCLNRKDLLNKEGLIREIEIILNHKKKEKNATPLIIQEWREEETYLSDVDYYHQSRTKEIKKKLFFCSFQWKVINLKTWNYSIDSFIQRLKKVFNYLNKTIGGSYFISPSNSKNKKDLNSLEFFCCFLQTDFLISLKELNQIFVSLLKLDENSFFLVKEKKKKEKKTTLKVEKNFLDKITKKKIGLEKIISICERFRCSASLQKKKIEITIPAYRTDLVRKEELGAEIIRFLNLENNLLNNEIGKLNEEDQLVFNKLSEDTSYKFKKELKNFLVNTGWQEVLSFSLIPEKDNKFFFLNKESSKVTYKIVNAKNKSYEVLRPNLFFSHLLIIKKNDELGKKEMFFFEISQIFCLNRNDEILSLTISLPKETKEEKKNYCLSKVKQAIEFIIIKLNINKESVFFELEKASSPEEKFNFSLLLNNEKKIGFVKEIEEEFLKKQNLNNSVIFFFSIYLNELYKKKEKFNEKSFFSPSEYPICKRDLSFFFSTETDLDRVTYFLLNNFERVLREVEVVDVFQDKKTKEDKRFSATFHLIFQDNSKTLEKEEIETIVKRIIYSVENKFRASLREKTRGSIAQ